MNWPFFLCLLSICSRGGLEMIVPKSLAYAISILGFFGFLLWFYIDGKAMLKIRIPVFLVSLVVMLASLLSLLSAQINGLESIYSIFIVYPIVIVGSFLIFYSVTPTYISRPGVEMAVTCLIIILFVMAMLQQFKIIDLPGATPAYGIPGDLARPSSLTGSYLHYPLVMVLLGVFLQSLKQKTSLVAILAFSSVFVAFSRSGMMLVATHCLLIFLYGVFNDTLRFRVRSIMISLITIVVVLFISIWTGFAQVLFSRIISSFDVQGIGNGDRIAAWEHGLRVISESNLLFGSNFGMATNLTSNLVGAHSYVVESSFLQSLINFGIFGTLAFIAMFVFMALSLREIYMKLFFISVFLQSMIYQSTEVLPFILGLMLLSSLPNMVERPFSVRPTSSGFGPSGESKCL